MWASIQAAYMPVIENIKGLLGGFVTFVSGVFTGNWGKAWQGVQEIFSNIMAGLGTLMKAPLNAVIGLINKAFANVGTFKVPDWSPFFPGATFSLPQIPLLYTGTRNWPGGPAIVGDRGPELLNLPRGSDVYSNGETNSILSRARDFGGAASSIVINVKNIIQGTVSKEQEKQVEDSIVSAVEAALERIEAKNRRLSFEH
jgi:hypothetical protein